MTRTTSLVIAFVMFVFSSHESCSEFATKCLDFVPKLMIFDTDRVFWPFCVETDLVPPFAMRRIQSTAKECRANNSVWAGNFGGRQLVDHNGTVLTIHSEAPQVIIKLRKKGAKLAVSTTTRRAATVKHLLHLFELDQFISQMEIDFESAVHHVKEIKEESGLEFKDLVYFGADQTVLNEIKKVLKVLTVHVNPEEGLNIKHMYKAIYFHNLRPYVARIKKQQLLTKLKRDEQSEEEYKYAYKKQPKPTPLRRTRTLVGGKAAGKYKSKSVSNYPRAKGRNYS